MDTANPYYLGEFITGSPCISLYPKTVSVNDPITIDGNVSLAEALNGDPLYYDPTVTDTYSKCFGFTHPSCGEDKEEFDGNLGIIDTGVDEFKHDFHMGHPFNTHLNYNPIHEYPDTSTDLQGYFDYSYLQPQKYYIDPIVYGNQVEQTPPNNKIEQVKAKRKKRRRKRGIKKLVKNADHIKTDKQPIRRRTRRTWVQSHKMVTRRSTKKTLELEESKSYIPGEISLKDEKSLTLAESIQEITPKIELQEQDLMPFQGITYYINSYTMHVFGTKKYRSNSKNLTCIIFSVPKEATNRQITIKYLFNYHQPFVPTIMLLESLKTHETFLNYCKDANLANKPHKIFSRVIKQLGKPSNLHNDSDSKTHFKKKKFKRSWKPDSINAINAARYITQPKPKPLGNWAGFFCGDYKSQNAVHSDYVEGLYLVDIDDIAIELDPFEHQFKWEIDLLWERGEIASEEKDAWYKLGGLDNECMEYHKLARERYEKNNEFYGSPDAQLDYPDNHVISNFNVINPPQNFTPLPPLIEPKLKYPRAEAYRGARTSYIKELDQDFFFKLSLHFPHEFINS